MLSEWVDFHYNVDGKTYAYSIPGGTAVSLRELLPVIGVIADDADTKIDEVQKFDDQIVDVTFSDDSLVRVAHPQRYITLKELKDQLGVTSIISAAYAVEEPDGAAGLQGIDDGAYVIDPSAGDTDGLSFTAPDVDELNQPAATEPQVEGETTDEADASTTEAGGNAEPTITVITDDDVIKAGTWVLISLKSFTSDEPLTVTMKNGDVFTVQVTDEQNGRWEVYFDGTLGQSSQTNASRRFYNGASNAKSTAYKGETITLPDVGGKVRWDLSRTYQVTAPTGTGYNYTLNGWYMINAAIGASGCLILTARPRPVRAAGTSSTRRRGTSRRTRKTCHLRQIYLMRQKRI